MSDQSDAWADGLHRAAGGKCAALAATASDKISSTASTPTKAVQGGDGDRCSRSDTPAGGTPSQRPARGMQSDQAATTLAVGPSGPEAVAAAARMEIDPHAGAVEGAANVGLLQGSTPGYTEARTTCQKWRALLGLAACALVLSAGFSMARRHTQAPGQP